MNYLDAIAAYASGEADWQQQLDSEERVMSSEHRDMYAGSGAHLKAADLRGQMVPVVIDRWERVDFNDGAKLVIGFQGKEKTLVLNKTNYCTIAEVYGDHADQWIGKAITLFSARVDYQGRQVDAIRVTCSAAPPVHAPPQQAATHHYPPPAAQQPAPAMAADFDDDIPF